MDTGDHHRDRVEVLRGELCGAHLIHLHVVELEL